MIQKEVIGYQGIEGAYSSIAASKIFGEQSKRAYLFFTDVITAVENETIQYGVLPFENSYTGEVGEVFDLLYQHNCYIIGMYDLPITHNLLGIKGSLIENISQVYSHQQALSQCHEYLKEYPKFELVPYGNTALAAQYINQEQDATKACIASMQTAELYQLEILATNINTSQENTTRFIVISKEQKTTGDYTSVMFTVENKVGSLSKIIQLISNHEFNMDSIKSKPQHNLPWEYYFYIELEGNINTENGKNLIKNLKEETKTIKILGTYQKGVKL